MNPMLCDISFYAYDGTQDYTDDKGKVIYVYDVYRLSSWRWRETLEADIETHYEDWKEAAYRVEYTALSDSIRAERDKLLAASDPRVLEDFPQTTEDRAAWLAYRQTLRDLPEQAGFPFTATWPDKPQ